VETKTGKKEDQETGLSAMNKSNRQGWAAGLYRPHGEIFKLWNMLSKGKCHNKAALLKSLDVKHPARRLKSLFEEGPKRRKNKTHTWRIEMNGIVRMVDLNPL
jgi:hypothetical protein